MNRAEVKNRIAAWSHRTDLVSQLDLFVDATTDYLNARLGLALTLQGDGTENVISRDYPMLYVYGGLREMASYLRDRTAMADYDSRFQEHISLLNVKAESELFTDDTPAMLSEVEQAVEAENAT